MHPAITVTEERQVVKLEGAQKIIASNQAQPLLTWWRRDLGQGPSKNRHICNYYVFEVVSQNLADRQRLPTQRNADVGPGTERHKAQGGARVSSVDDVAWELREEVTGVLCPCPSSWTVRLFDAVVSWISSSSLWTSPLCDAESRAAKEHRSCLGWKSFRCWAINWFREVTDLSVASFCLWRPEWWHTGIVKKGKKKRTERGSSSSGKTDICRFWYKPFGMHFVSSIQVTGLKDVLFIRQKESTCAKQESWFNKNGSTWRFLLVARHAATLGLWRAIPWAGELPFLKGFSLWTNQSKRVSVCTQGLKIRSQSWHLGADGRGAGPGFTARRRIWRFFLETCRQLHHISWSHFWTCRPLTS